MIRPEIRTRVRSILKDEDSANYTWGVTTLDDFIEDAISDIATHTGLLKSRETVTEVASELAFFDAPAYTIAIKAVSYAGKLLAPMTPEEAVVFSEDDAWEDETGPDPLGYIYGPYGERRFRVFPMPETALTAGSFGVHVTRTQTAALTESTEPEFPRAYHRAVVYGVVVLAYSQDFDMRHPEKAVMYIRMQDKVLSKVGGSPYRDRLPENQGAA